MTHEVINGDCLVEMPRLIERGVTVDACITDPPFEITGSVWDKAIPFAPMWANLARIVKRRGATVLFGSQPFSSALILSNAAEFKYEWIWRKNRPTNFAHAKNKPMKRHENILVFSQGTTVHVGQSADRMTYNPQGLTEVNQLSKTYVNDACFTARPSHGDYIKTHEGYPDSVLDFDVDNLANSLHPNQKPVKLMRYLVRTYTNPGETVLDFTAGSFTTGVACAIEGRNFIGIECDEHYCAVGRARIQRAKGEWAEIPRLNRRNVPTPLFDAAEAGV